ncbi:MAG: deoxyribose-phosphate aldolase [Phycisphaeraceae bacterium]|nr:deoxyribose-phosphate aldolase [Phycisphaeraceae bacterium]
MMTSTELAGRIDHTLLSAEASAAQIDQLVEEAIKFEFASVCVHGAYVDRVVEKLRAADAAPVACCVVGFPLGANKSTVKAIEAAAAVKSGALEIDMVAFLPALLEGDLAAARADAIEVVKAARAANPRTVVKLIVESALLVQGMDRDGAESRIALACRIARESGCDFIKTSTGFHPAGGADVDSVRWMKQHAGGIRVKASGGIRTYADAVTMLDAGADRLGCSAGVKIIGGSGQTGQGY